MIMVEISLILSTNRWKNQLAKSTSQRICNLFLALQKKLQKVFPSARDYYVR